MEYDKDTLTKMLAEAEQDKIALEGHILYLKRKLGLPVDSPAGASAPPSPGGITQSAEIKHDSFFGMPIADAAKRYLEMTKAPKTTNEIIEALEKGGLLHSSKNFYNTAGSVISRKKDVFVSVKGKWGLVEWYPQLKRSKSEASSAKDGAA